MFPDAKRGLRRGVGKNVRVGSVFFCVIRGFANALSQGVVSIVFVLKFRTVPCTLLQPQIRKQAAQQKQAFRFFFLF